VTADTARGQRDRPAAFRCCIIETHPSSWPQQGVFVILAYLKTKASCRPYVDRCSLQLLVQYARLLEWLFSNGDDGRWLRKLMVTDSMTWQFSMKVTSMRLITKYSTN
jgi:hypothetical protein